MIMAPACMLRSGLAASVVLSCLSMFTSGSLRAEPPDLLNYQIEVTKARSGYDGKMCWVHARAGAIPTGVPANRGQLPIVVLTMQRLDVTGNDVFFGLNDLRTDDAGKTWSGPKPHDSLSRRDYPQGGEIVISDHWPKWHAKSGKLLGTGHTVRYVEGRVDWAQNPRSTAYTVYDPATREWSAWRALEVPANTPLASSGAGCTQRVDLPNGDILLPVYTNALKDGQPGDDRSVVVRCQFDGTTLKYVEHGNELVHDTGRGYSEPSLAKFGDAFYLTLRNDDFAAVARSQDGLHFDEPKKWTFDDGQDLGSYNTQAHWVTHSDGLFLVYTRKGANNDHVMRHRAPLFIAQVDPARMVVLRKSERVLVPERGARLGNFGITVVNEHETWVTVTEWMQTKGPNYVMPVNNKYGSDNSLYVSKIRWSKPNKLAPE